MTVYVAGDVRSIQDYIFSSTRLYEMRGASALLSFFDRAVVPQLVSDFGGKVISSGGGNFLAEFEERPIEELVAAVKDAFFDLTGGHDVAIEALATELPFPAAQAELHRRLRRRKHQPEEARASASMPFLKRCESCGREPADVDWPLPGAAAGDPRRQWLGPACHRKRLMHKALAEQARTGRPARQGVHGVAELLDVSPIHPRLVGADPPPDFETLVGEDDLATLVADGNGLGDWFAERERDSFRDLSKHIANAFETAISAALDEAYPGVSNPQIQVLVCGGDDLVVALPARHALRFARALLESFRVTDPDRPERQTGLAAGLLLSKHSFPFRQAHALAEELLHRAKARCQEEGLLSALDFLRVTATHVRSLARELEQRERDNSVDRGWSYGAAGPYTLEELGRLLDLAEELRRKVTPSQRGKLREILSPRDDGPETPLDPEWQVPQRLVAELRAWSLRQDQEPFDQPLATNWTRFVRTQRRELSGGGHRIYQRWQLHDALILAELAEG
jgi:hypothetical protein